MADSREGTFPFVPVLLLGSLAAMAFGPRNEPFRLTRPPREPERVASDASVGVRRLWEDPFLNRPAPKTPIAGFFERAGEDRLMPADRTICVTLQSDNTPEDRESRRCTRYAVHSAMTGHGYKAVDPELLRYCSADGRRVPYEDFTRSTSPSASEPTDAERQSKRGTSLTRVYWIDERQFSGDQPGEGLLSNLTQAGLLAADRGTVIGPTTSTVFANMEGDFKRLRSSIQVLSPVATRYEGRWYDGKEATYDLPARKKRGHRVAVPVSAPFQRGTPLIHPAVSRTIHDDRLVARALIAELAARGIEANAIPGEGVAAHASRARRVLLIIERDSDFARAWKEYLEEAWKAVFAELDWPNKDQTKEEKERKLPEVPAEPLFEVTYFSRGLDGMPREESAQGAATIENPEGCPTLDYLRRLCASLASQQIAAVGVFGQDVHDKLLVMQAARPLLTEAVFFTNDIDAYFGHPRTLDYTRNLIVASSFDLVPDCYEGEHVTPFRNQYQTAMYEAVARALNHGREAVSLGAEAGASDCCEKEHGARDAETGDPRDRRVRLFEIGVKGPIPLSDIKPEQSPDKQAGDPESTQPGSQGGIGSGTLLAATEPKQETGAQGVDSKPLQSGSQADTSLGLGWWAIGGLAMAAILFVVGFLTFDWRLRKGVKVASLRWSLWIAFVLPVLVAGSFTLRYGWAAWRQEPLEWMDGVSVWPTEMLRLVAYYLSLVFAVELLSCLREDYRKIDERFEAESLWALPWLCTWLGDRVDQVVGGLRRFAGVQSTPSCGATELGRVDGWFGRRFGRPRLGVHALCALGAAALFFGSMYGLMLILGLPHVPARGALARGFDLCAMIGSVVAMLWLLLLVAGTSLRIAYLITRLKEARLGSRESSPKRFTEQDQDLVARLRLVESIADLGGSCIYGPFIVMLVLIVSRWKGFDNWSWPLPLVIVIAFSVVMALTSAYILTRAARGYRKESVHRIDLQLRESTDDKRTKSLEHLRAQVLGIDTGVFAGVGGHPAVRALLIPAGGLGGLSLLPLLT